MTKRIFNVLFISVVCFLSFSFVNLTPSVQSVVEATTSEEIALAQRMIIGTWEGTDGRVVKITERGFGKASYSIQDVADEDGEIVITIAVNGGRTIDSLTFEHGDGTHMVLNNLTNGFEMEYSRVE